MNEKTRLKKESKKRMLPFFDNKGLPFRAQSIGRNELCPCKSGKKVKNCCKLETRYYTKKKETEKEPKL